jgi:NAD(P)-dependent dehydrogenase (short-subunit alcohol dehydrogenase family)
VGAVVEEVLARLGRIDVLVNCAGAPANETPFGELTWDGWRQTLDVDVRGAFNLCQRVLPLMSERRSGMILNVASSAAWAAYEQLVSYAPGKAALVAFSRCLDAYGASSGVAVHCLCPTLTTETSLGRQAIEAHAEHFGLSPEDYVDRYVAKPLLTPEMVGEAAIRLADVRPGDVARRRLRPSTCRRQRQADRAAGASTDRRMRLRERPEGYWSHQVPRTGRGRRDLEPWRNSGRGRGGRARRRRGQKPQRPRPPKRDSFTGSVSSARRRGRPVGTEQTGPESELSMLGRGHEWFSKILRASPPRTRRTRSARRRAWHDARTW